MMTRGKLKGGALYIALIICIIISIILSVFILIAHFNQRQVLTTLANEQLRWNLRSAFHIAQSDNFSEEQNNRWFKGGVDADSIKIKMLQWGAYVLLETQTKNSHQFMQETGLYGCYPSADTALYIEDSGRPINLGGSIRFNAPVYFPASGYKTAYIEGAGAVIDPSISGRIRKSSGSVPAIKKSLIEKLIFQLQHPEAITDSLCGLDGPFLHQPFSANTRLIRSGNFNLRSCQLSHNIKLVANAEIILDSSAHLDNVLLIAAKIRFKKGFKGAVHALASDSIVLEDGCRLLYPSSLTVVNYDAGGTSLKGIFVGETCRVEGSLLAINNGGADQKVIVSTKRECEIYGLVYSSNYASVQGTLYGTLYCSRLLLQTPSAVYENHLLNCAIDPKKYASSLYVPAIFESGKSKKCVKKL